MEETFSCMMYKVEEHIVEIDGRDDDVSRNSCVLPQIVSTLPGKYTYVPRSA